MQSFPTHGNPATFYAITAPEAGAPSIRRCRNRRPGRSGAGVGPVAAAAGCRARRRVMQSHIPDDTLGLYVDPVAHQVFTEALAVAGDDQVALDQLVARFKGLAYGGHWGTLAESPASVTEGAQ